MDDDFSAHGDLESNDDEHSQAETASMGMVKQEIKMMNVVRTFVFALIITFSTITAEVIFIVVLMHQERTFHDEFTIYSTELIQGFYDKLQQQLVVAGTLSTSLTLDVAHQDNDNKGGGGNWPYVSFTEFELRCAGARQLAKASSVSYAPLVVPETQDFWEAYATYTDGQGLFLLDDGSFTDTYQPHLGHPHAADEESVFYFDTNRSVADGIYSLSHGQAVDLKLGAGAAGDRHQSSVSSLSSSISSSSFKQDSSASPSSSLSNVSNASSSSSFFSSSIAFPLWQRSPTTLDKNQKVDVRMYDQMSNPVRSQALSALLLLAAQARKTNQTTQDDIVVAGTDDGDSDNGMNMVGGVLTDFLIHDTNWADYAYYSTPRTSLYVPIFNSTNNDNNKQQAVVATVEFEFMWETFLEDILDEDVASLVVVVESSCGYNNNQEFSFQVEGINVTFLGSGDLSTDPASFSAPLPLNSTYDAYRQIFHIMNHIHNNNANTSTILSSSSNNNNNKTEQDTQSRLLPCSYRLRVYATEEFKAVYLTTLPTVCKFAVLGVFLFIVAVFLVYDCVVEQKSNNVVESAKRTDALVSTLFPSNVKQRLLEQADAKQKAAEREQKTRSTWHHSSGDSHDTNKNNCPRTSTASGYFSDESSLRSHMIHTPKGRLKSMLHSGGSIVDDYHGDIDDTEPIADLFPSASVMFADVAGFTAWSSERDPSQVFKLLETLYRSMDKAARRFRVFKVETIGDCYVAATGLPEQREDHVEALCRFARTSLIRTTELTRALESTLGPGTAELAFRFGIHSGPVTAGVLRGEKARFQLFGDTMNFAARIETTGAKNKIHLSQASAEMLIKRGKGHWVEKREETVYAKGKGELQTYWLQLGASSVSQGTSISSGDSIQSSEFSVGDDNGENNKNVNSRRRPTSAIGVSNGANPENVLMGVIGETKLNRSIDRLVEWNTSSLAVLLKKVVASRMEQTDEIPEQKPGEPRTSKTSRSFMSELKLFIALPKFDELAVARAREASVDLPPKVERELRMYVAAIASGYRKNAFHNFEHASHVILSATKLLKRISYADGHVKQDGVTTQDLHDYTYGISSDPLTQFAVVFAALIHDVGHEGVPNGQLAQELPNIAEMYENRSVAEQRSVDVALELLMLPKYNNLRACICGNQSGQQRFRQLLVHCVLATDIFEKDLKAQRNQRWEQAFHTKDTSESEEDIHCKATIVLEHIIQASDVSHTMQHWHVYVKWNERLFQEMYAAYKSGRAKKDPSEGWYKGELWFFDYYVIPLAKKLKECGVFGVSSDEYLDYSVQNRAEWEARGEEIVRSMKERFEQTYAKKEKIQSVPEGDENVYRDDSVPAITTQDNVDGDDGDFSTHSYSEH